MTDPLPADDDLRATLTLETNGAGRVGTNRIALLRAIAATGSISAAARAVGMTYKGAWDAVQVLNNLFSRPLVIAATGGRDGGTSVVSAAGEAVIAAFGATEAALAAAAARLQNVLAIDDPAALQPVLWGMMMKTSARNALRGTVTRVTIGTIGAEVVLDVGDGVEIVATITRESAADLELAPGGGAIALIKSSFVILARGDMAMRTSARNALAGTVVRREDGALSSEITLELTQGKTLTATVTKESADLLQLTPGTSALALVKASHVILAVA
ncbi:TOBE domain-containing protein [Sphingomonas sp. AR_OL41]|uniref:TOBE domain-containing protein n=1 Tax=Sphingomonas sp. AR_OL41 TaxID=3042729 RepID=UPI0024814BF2|nr:TOBE domain-containing protein [Sphingomonas sp. AR_OL41]MDH7973572.1 TOBE domain-containing protein [Sphingomonas sp. AR_OL41]